jgi:hypothetical protein
MDKKLELIITLLRQQQMPGAFGKSSYGIINYIFLLFVV